MPDLLAMYLRFVLQMNNSNCLPISGDVVKSMKFHETMENNGFGCSDANSLVIVKKSSPKNLSADRRPTGFA